ncbi:MAG: 30S ribosomal protein S21, partial [Planctomycetes bacterium]|nr:30S ribosomal protein S21 [Planctomycetota bacterium]
IRVLVKNNEPLEKTLRRLRKICNNEGVTRDLKRSSFYEKPSERRRRKERERIKNLRKAERGDKGKKGKKKDKEKEAKDKERKERREFVPRS